MKGKLENLALGTVLPISYSWKLSLHSKLYQENGPDKSYWSGMQNSSPSIPTICPLAAVKRSRSMYLKVEGKHDAPWSIFPSFTDIQWTTLYLSLRLKLLVLKQDTSIFLLCKLFFLTVTLSPSVQCVLRICSEAVPRKFAVALERFSSQLFKNRLAVKLFQ